LSPAPPDFEQSQLALLEIIMSSLFKTIVVTTLIAITSSAAMAAQTHGGGGGGGNPGGGTPGNPGGGNPGDPSYSCLVAGVNCNPAVKTYQSVKQECSTVRVLEPVGYNTYRWVYRCAVQPNIY
jgi:hypothetical protein